MASPQKIHETVELNDFVTDIFKKEKRPSILFFDFTARPKKV